MKRLALNVRALAVGVIAGVSLVTLYAFVVAKFYERTAAEQGGSLLIPADMQVGFSAFYSSVVATFLALLSVPLWLLLARCRVTGPFVAAALGFVMTLGFWVLSNQPGHPVLGLIQSGFVFAVCGAVAGIATWWARPRS